jgi:hypothetical protein
MLKAFLIITLVLQTAYYCFVLLQLFSDVQGDEFNVDSMEMTVLTWSDIDDRPVISSVNSEERKLALEQQQQHAATAADTQHKDVPAKPQ